MLAPFVIRSFAQCPHPTSVMTSGGDAQHGAWWRLCVARSPLMFRAYKRQMRAWPRRRATSEPRAFAASGSICPRAGGQRAFPMLSVARSRPLYESRLVADGGRCSSRRVSGRLGTQVWLSVYSGCPGVSGISPRHPRGVKVSAARSLEAAGNVSGSGRGGRDLPGD